nr:hypothetical protein [Candidatus Pantoea persica]MBA2814475.1 oligopeptide ABC transporter substrate-binding protein OppA [Candidatus Pantoea persica]
MKALDDRHLQVTLSEPVPYFIFMLANTAMSPVNAATVEKWGDAWLCRQRRLSAQRQGDQRKNLGEAHYAKAEQIMDKNSTIVPVYYYVNARLVKPYVGGYTGKDPLDKTLDKNFYIIKY